MQKRIITAVIAVPLIILLVRFSPPAVFFAALVGVTVLALKELFGMMIVDEPAVGRWSAVGLGCLVPLAVFAGGAGNGEDPFFLLSAVLVFCFVVFFCYHITLPGKYENAFPVISAKFFGTVYIPALFSYLLLIRAFPRGGEWLLFLLFVTWAGDSGAYFTGTWIGKKPLAPKISPNKTVEGAVGSFVTGIAVAVLCRALFLNAIPLAGCVLLGMGINVFNQFGDLAESKIKRAYRVKNSGTLIPGHGGVLDRIDSLLFAAPFLYYCLKVFDISL